jgi:hypothetical protein
MCSLWLEINDVSDRRFVLAASLSVLLERHILANGGGSSFTGWLAYWTNLSNVETKPSNQHILTNFQFSCGRYSEQRNILNFS